MPKRRPARLTEEQHKAIDEAARNGLAEFRFWAARSEKGPGIASAPVGQSEADSDRETIASASGEQ